MSNQDYNDLLNRSIFFTPQKQELVKLNCGCGPNVFPYNGWKNFDKTNLKEYFDYIKNVATETSANPVENKYVDQYIERYNCMPDHQKKLVKYLQDGGKIEYFNHDLRTGFPQFKDNSVDIIYLGQVIEHCNPIHETPKLLQEFHRILKKGGILRMTTPDLNILIKAYLMNDMTKFTKDQPDFYKDYDPASQLAFIMYGATGSGCKTENYEGHMFLFSQQSMTKFLQNAGFTDITFYYEPGKSKSSVLAEECVDEGLSHSFIVEVVK